MILPMDGLTLIQEIEAMIRMGQQTEARAKLLNIKLSQIPRAQAHQFANLSRRMGLASHSLKILRPPGTDFDLLRTSEEKIEYAASLRSLGLVGEAEEVLQQVDASESPQALFHLALCLMSRWDYRSTIPLMKAYIESREPGSYERRIGRINLLQSYIYCGSFYDAIALRDELLAEVSHTSDKLAYKKSLELAAQLEVARENWEDAILRLSTCRNETDSSGSPLETLFVKKWLAIAESSRLSEVNPALRNVRESARNLGHWETVRDCDYYIGKIDQDSAGLTRLYFGTPYESFREKILLILPADSQIPESYLWTQQSRIQKVKTVLDLSRACSEDGKIVLAPGSGLHRLLIALSRDFYRPVSGFSLFAFLYSGERFNPHTSPNRIRQVIKRFRQWVQTENVALELKELNGSYSLDLEDSIAVAVMKEGFPLDGRQDLELLKLRRSIATESFTSQEASRVLGSSQSSSKRLLKWAVDANRLIVSRQANEIRYTFR
jgi:hypothetical protein